jgi:hypothetical protein
VLGLLLWFFPAKVTNRIVSGDKLSGDRFGVREFERVALTILGAWLVAYGVADLIYDVTSVIVTQRDFPQQRGAFVPHMPRIFASAAKVIIGISLVIGAKGIARIIDRVRGEG